MSKLKLMLPALAGLASAFWLPYQQAWINDQSSAAIWEKSRRVGADYCESYKCLHERLSGERKVDYWYSSADESAALEFAEYVKAWLQIWNRVAEFVSKEGIDDDGKAWLRMTFKLPEIDGKSTRITVMTSNPKRFRSKGGDVTLSELAFHEQPEEMWKACGPVTTWGGRIRVLSSHNGYDSWFNQLLLQALKYQDPEQYGKPKSTDFKASVHRVDIYEAIADGINERINHINGTNVSDEDFIASLKSRCATIEIWTEEYECQPSKQSGSYFPHSLITPCVSQEAPVPTDDLDTFIADISARIDGVSRIAAGCDIGRKKDRFVIWTLGRSGSNRITLGILVLENKSFDIMETAINTLMKHGFGSKRVRRICIDDTGLGMQLAERMEKKHRARAEGVTMTNSSKEDMFTRARAAFEERTIDIPDDDVVRSDISAIRKEVTASGKNRYSATSNRLGHSDRATAMALCLVADESAKTPMRKVKMKKGSI